MKRTLIASIVGGIIFFVCQALSWTVINLHRPMQNHTPNQTAILDYLSKNLEEGFYYLPTYPNGASTADIEKVMANAPGKPWAQIYYHKSSPTNMAPIMARSLLIDILVVFILVFVLSKMNYPSFQTILLCSLAIGFMSYLSTSYTNSIWFETKSLPDLIESLAIWGIVGTWLGWFLRR